MRKGSALLLVIIVSAILMALAVFAVQMVYNCHAGGEWVRQREQAFWLAEAGLETGKVKLADNPVWYTDLPHSPEDDSSWLKNGAVGEKASLGYGTYKVIRKKDQGRLYAVGRKGRATVVLTVKFSSFPFRVLSWQEI